jgi:hypothetical protein
LYARLNTTAAALLAATFVIPLAGQQNQFESSEAVFTVMAALNAAGMDNGLATSHPLRATVRAELAKRNIECLPDIKKFVAEHHKDDPAADLAQYLSFALAVKGAPDFESRFRQNEIPPDVGQLQGFDALMIRFYRDADIPELWKQAQPSIQKEMGRYHDPISNSVEQAQGYLRYVASGLTHGQFRVYLDLLGPANQVHTRSYKGDMFVVLTPAVEPQAADVRHAYLHFVLDPLAVRNAAVIDKKRALTDFASGAPLLDQSYKDDFLLLLNESLIKAIESRLARPGERKPLVDESLADGYILTPYFAEALPKYEKQEQSMRYYYPELVGGISVKSENERLANVKFATERKARPAPPPLRAAPQQTLAEKEIDDADDLYKARELDKARAVYTKVLQSSDQALHARAYYGLAKIAALEKNPELADELFRKTLEVAPDPDTRAWTEVYLGRLAFAAREPEQAADHFNRALSVEGASDEARKAAGQELQRARGQQ